MKTAETTRQKIPKELIYEMRRGKPIYYRDYQKMTVAEVKEHGDLFGYLTEKTEDLLAAGVERVIWMLTETRKVVVAEPNTPWLLAKWSDSIPVIDDVTMRINQFMEQLDGTDEGASPCQTPQKDGEKSC